MSMLFSDLERAAAAVNVINNCSSANTVSTTYASQVAVALQQQQQSQQHNIYNSHHHLATPNGESCSSPTLQQLPLTVTQSPLGSSMSASSTPTSSSESPITIHSSSVASSVAAITSLVISNNTNNNNNNNNANGSNNNNNNTNGHNLSPMDSNSALVEDQRALQLAFELSMVGLSDTIVSHTQTPQHHHHQQHHHQQQQQLHQQSVDLNHHQQQQQQSQQQHHNQVQNYGDLSSVTLANQQLLQQQQSTTNGMLINNNDISNGLIGNGCSTNGGSGNIGVGVSLSSVLQQQQQQQQQHSINSFASILPPAIDERSKKSQNMTECVPVPSSEHVAEIVGRQGCKIKALRAKTNTYIKTPVRGEEPVFVVTGRKEDVAKAKREILSAAEHFSLIRASRKPTLSGVGGKGSPPGPPTNIPGQVTIQVRVPYRVVGLVVGPKGATIKHIQQQTHTYIVTPSRDKEPIFEVTGMPDNVQSARRQIEAHIALRTGNIAIAGNAAAAAAAAAACPNGNGTVTTAVTNSAGTNMTGLGSLLSEETNSEFLASLYKNGFGSLIGYLDPTLSNGIGPGSNDLGLSVNRQQVGNGVSGNGLPSFHQIHQSVTGGTGTPIDTNHHNHHHHHITNPTTAILHHRQHHTLQQQQHSQPQYAPVVLSANSSINGSRSCSSSSSSTSSKSAARSQPELINIWKSLGDSIDIDEGLGESPNIWTIPPVTSALGSRCSPSTSVSPTDSLLGGAGGSSNSSSSNVLPVTNGDVCNGSNNNDSTTTTVSISTTVNAAALLRRECLVCGDKEVTAALVPCGHNMFCMDCATRVCTSGNTANDGICPVCSQTVIQAIRIIP